MVTWFQGDVLKPSTMDINLPEDFQLTACMGLLKQVLFMNGFKESEFESHADRGYPTEPKVAKVTCFDHKSSAETVHTLKGGTMSSRVCEDDYDDDFDDDDDDDDDMKDADKKKVNKGCLIN